MSRHISGICLLAVLCSSGCSMLPHKSPPPVTYDLGPASPSNADASQSAIVFQGVSAPVWLDSNAIEYRLAYQDEFRRQSYRDSRWVAPPAVLLRQRFVERLSQEAGARASDSPFLLRIELDEFAQIFDTPHASRVQVQLRATIQSSTAPTYTRVRTFTVARMASTPDSAGAIRAFASAVDGIVAQTLAWSATSAASGPASPTSPDRAR